MKNQKFIAALIAFILIFVFVVACEATPTEQPATAVATPSMANNDNATSGAAQRSTRQAQATLNGQATLNMQATATAWASQTAQAQAKATALVVARVTGQAVFAAKSAWPKVISESFKDNALGWPLGVTTDTSPVVTASIADGGYLWSVVVPESNSYINLIPRKGPEFSAFYANVSVQFMAGDSNDQTSYGLVFRNVDRDYGFFGISPSGNFRILDVSGGGISSMDQESSPLIDTRSGKVNRIGVIAIGPDFVFLINDQVVGQINAQLDPGQIGLGVDALMKADQAKVRFSDFEVSTP